MNGDNDAAYWVRDELNAKQGELRLALLALQDEVKALREESNLHQLALQVLLNTVADMKEAKNAQAPR